MLRIITLAAALSFAASLAHAGNCPNVMAEIDAALTTASISEADKTKVMELRTEGETLHGSGDHAGSMAKLDEAKKLLGM